MCRYLLPALQRGLPERDEPPTAVTIAKARLHTGGSGQSKWLMKLVEVTNREAADKIVKSRCAFRALRTLSSRRRPWAPWTLSLPQRPFLVAFARAYFLAPECILLCACARPAVRLCAAALGPWF